MSIEPKAKFRYDAVCRYRRSKDTPAILIKVLPKTCWVRKSGVIFSSWGYPQGNSFSLGIF